jgi:hypothetical protein
MRTGSPARRVNPVGFDDCRMVYATLTPFRLEAVRHEAASSLVLLSAPIAPPVIKRHCGHNGFRTDCAKRFRGERERAAVHEPKIGEFCVSPENEIANDAAVHMGHGHTVSCASDRINRTSPVKGSDLWRGI